MNLPITNHPPITLGVMTLWTAPSNGRLPGSRALWSLSALCARQHFEKLELFTDDAGERMLIDELGLPFDRVHKLSIHPSLAPLWSVAKLMTYGELCMSHRPFIHLDGDVVLTRPLPDRLLTAPVCAESPEEWTPPEHLHPLWSLPPVWRHALAEPLMWNCGIFGGHDLAKILRYVSEALKVVSVNHLNIASGQALPQPMDRAWCSMMLEQWGMARAWRRDQVETLFDTPLPDAAARAEAGYCHFKGASKAQPDLLARIECELARRFPSQLARLSYD